MTQKVTKIWIILVIFLLSGLFLSAGVMAARTMPSSGDPIQVRTDVKAYGSEGFRQYTSLEYIQSSVNVSDSPPLNPGELIGQMGVVENGLAQGGETTYTGYLQLDTSSKDLGNNLDAQKRVTFEGTPGEAGRMLYSQTVGMHVIGNSTDLAEANLCPLGSDQQGSQGGSYDERVSAGSSFDVSQMDLTTVSGVRTISDSGASVNLQNSVNAYGINGTTSQAVGSGQASIHASSMQGNGTTQTTSLNYDDITEVDGLFELAKTSTYNS